MSYKIDLHMHTYYSDGVLSPTEIVKRAKKMKYDMIAITDHDGVGGVAEGVIAGNALEITVIPGIELSAYADGNYYVHILGYHIDIENKELLGKLEEIRQNRHLRNRRLLEVLEEMGYPLGYDDLQATQGRDYVGKPNIAKALVQKGYAGSYEEAFASQRLLASPEALAVKKQKVSSRTAIELIGKAGGIAVLAHPMKIKALGDRGSREFYDNLDNLVKGLKKEGLKGMECYHSQHTQEESLKLVEFAEKYHLHVTEGSDFHGWTED